MTMSIRVVAIAAATILSTLATGAAAGETRPPTAPYIIHASGARWIPGCSLWYEVFADGVLLGSLTDNANDSAVWGGQQFTHAGPSTVTVKAVDAAGNRSAPSNADVVTAYAC